MGQQQLLLIVLGVIIVGVAVVAGIGMFNAGSEEAGKDELVAQCMSIGSHAQQYFKKPTSMGGGNNSYAGYVLPATMDSTTNGTYAAGTGTAASITITATPKTGLGYEFTSVVCTVTPTNISTVVNQ